MARVQLLSPPGASQKGDASMSYPIDIPRGVNGMQPKLAVTYSSSKGNGWMGEGWDISGVSGITLDTRWGTPAFDEGFESEIYLLDGEMLMYEGDYLPHRHVDVPGSMDISRQSRNRSGSKRFYLRKNNNFIKIERFGAYPSDYTWVVTTTDGTKKYYGGTETTVSDNAVVKKDDGNIVQWGITKEIDVHNNNIKYNYLNRILQTNSYPVNSGNINLAKGRVFHIATIKYSGVGDADGPYTVSFAPTDINRPDYSINTREGVKRVVIDKLSTVNVYYDNMHAEIKYSFDYDTGQYYKTVLKGLQGPGVNYQFEYYNDISKGDFGPAKVVNAPKPEAFSGAVNGALSPSRISADNNFEWGWSLRIGVGLGLFTPHTSGDKNFMVSGFVGESYPDIKRGQELLDFNGDGIADILYRKRNGDNGIRLIPGSLDGAGNLSFDTPETNVLNLNSNFNKTTGSTLSTGATILFNWWKMGFDFTKSWSESKTNTPVYLIDANSDGLPDVVKDDKVWFNRINDNGQPEMVTTSDMTENMVMKGSIPVPYTEPEDIDRDEAEEPVKAKNDVVRVWIAPKPGYVTITDNISITDMQETKARAVYSIEMLDPRYQPKNGRLFLTTLIGGNPSQPISIEHYNDYQGTPLGIDSSSRIYVESGEKIYFRLHKKAGVNYEVNSAPSVQYVNAQGVAIPDTAQEELDGFQPNNLRYEDKYFLNNLTKTLKCDVLGSGSISIPGFTVPRLNDNVTFKITLSKVVTSGPSNIIVLYTKTYSESAGPVDIDAVDMNYSTPMGEYHLKFSVESDSYMHKDLEWKNILVTQYGAKAYDVASYPSYYVRDFKKKFHVADLGNMPGGINDYYISLNQNFGFSPALLGSFFYVIKKNGHVLGKRWVKISYTGLTETSLNGTGPIPFYTGNPYQAVKLEDKIDIVVYCNTRKDRDAYEALKSQLQKNMFNIHYGSNTYLGSTEETALNTAEFNSISAVYHNWGQFIYNESKDVKRTQNQLNPPTGPRDIPTQPSGVTTPDYVVNSDTPRDSYGALINSEFLDSPFGQFNYDFGSCDGITDQNEYGECIGDIVQADFQSMANTNILAGFNPIVPMTTYKAKENNVLVEKWINNGFTEQFSKPASFRDEETMAPFFVDDDPDEADVEVAGNASTSMYAIEKKQKSKAKTTNWGIGIPVISKSTSELRGYGNINTQDFFDVNGDGYPDMLYRTESQLTNSLGGLNGSQGRNLENNADSVISNSDSFQSTNTIAFSVSAVKTVGRNTNNTDSDSKPDTSPSWSGGTSFSDFTNSYDKAQKYWMDINGDGLPDRVEVVDGQVQYKLNYGNGRIDNAFEPFPDLAMSSSAPVGATSVSIGGGLSGMLAATSTFSAGWGVSGSLTGSSSTGSSKVSLQDVNGDGLVDLLSTDKMGYTSVSYNSGNRFESPQSLSRADGSVNLGNDSATYNGALTLNGGFYLNIPIVWLFGVTILYFRAGADMSANIGVSMSEINKGLRDINGDGFPDLVINHDNGLQVNYSNVGRTNKLAKVTEVATNGSFVIDYEFTTPTYNDPNARLVMKEVTILNPNVDSNTYTQPTLEKDMVARFTYLNSRYDRRERSHYGFSEVITENMKGTNVYSKTAQSFYNSTYYNNGLPRKTDSYMGPATLKGITINQYKQYKYVNNYTQLAELPEQDFESYDTGGTKGNKMTVILPTVTVNSKLESGGTLTTSSTMTYNDKGQLTAFRYASNDPLGSYFTTMMYHDIATLTAKNILNIPSEIKVFNNSNTMMRQRNSQIDPNTGVLMKVMVKLNNTETAETNYTYDSFGNIKSVKNPVGYILNYDYDILNKYVIKVTDSFGVFSSSIYDPIWDSLIESTDAAGHKIKYTYDDYGRLTTILGPKENGISPYTVKYNYSMNPFSANNNQINLYTSTTQNYDPDHPNNPIETITFADCMGRTVQVKKDIQIGADEKMSVSGMTEYDVFGRPVKQYQSTFEAKDAVLNKKLKTSLSPYFSTVEYDALGRVVKEWDEEGRISISSYDIEGALFKKTITKEQNLSTNLKSENLSNAEGKVIVSRNYLGTQPLVTTFKYDAVGQLLTSTDPENKTTTYTYDLGGRRTQELHPDRGLTNIGYDKAGQIKGKSTANLLNTGMGIRYRYNVNRLTEIIYTDLPNGAVNPANVKYTYGTTGNGIGKVVTKKDGTGDVNYTYGDMGEVSTERRRVMGVYISAPSTFTTKYIYDSWNRIKNITYADGESVEYNYDLGGNVKSVKSNLGDYVKDIQYDEFEQRTKILNGNNTYSTFTYTPKKRQLRVHSLIKDNYTTFLQNAYDYDFVGNIISNTNSGNITPNQLGGNYYLGYAYDSLNRLTYSVGAMLKNIKEPMDPSNMNASYETFLTYTSAGGINTKRQTHSVSGVTNTLNTYNNSYTYKNGTHQAITVSNLNNSTSESLTYDLNGNPVENISSGKRRQMFWDEEDNMKAYFSKDEDVFQYHAYDDNGDRIIKYNLKSGPKLYQNGVLVDGKLELKGYTLYPSPYLVVSSEGAYTNHYYIGSQRIASRVSKNASGVLSRMAPDAMKDISKDEAPDLEGDFKTYLDKAGIDNTSIEAALTISPAQAGLFYLHGDQLGTANFVTDDNGVASQFFLNLPFGETFVEQKVTGKYDNPYKFNAKELDSETGLYYYGARYFNPRLSFWYGVDPLAGKMPNWNPYVYTFDNPVRFTDPDGMAPKDIIYLNNDGSINRVVNNGSKYITLVHKNKSLLLGNLPMAKNYEFNMKASKNVIAYYGSKIGATNISTTSERSNNSTAYYNNEGGIVFNAQKNGYLHPMVNNKYDLMNIAYHENMHKYDDNHNIEASTFYSHAVVANKAVNHWTFKESSTTHQEGEVAYFSQLIMNSYYQEGNPEQALDLINNFNTNKSGYSLLFDKSTGKMYINTPSSGTKSVTYEKSNSAPNLK
ncbi:RHS repeat-associated core domain-containing protein [Chryseobacterium timonianum]|nr:SpvB/TcaC N-terminal domain-containing protein [Chryseobacterium timonianum]